MPNPPAVSVRLETRSMRLELKGWIHPWKHPEYGVMLYPSDQCFVFPVLPRSLGEGTRGRGVGGKGNLKSFPIIGVFKTEVQIMVCKSDQSSPFVCLCCVYFFRRGKIYVLGCVCFFAPQENRLRWTCTPTSWPRRQRSRRCGCGGWGRRRRGTGPGWMGCTGDQRIFRELISPEKYMKQCIHTTRGSAALIKIYFFQGVSLHPKSICIEQVIIIPTKYHNSHL